jgi:hypothetical protein
MTGILVRINCFLHGPLEQLESVVPTLNFVGGHDFLGIDDCFGRVSAHRWLDALDQDPPEFDVGDIDKEDYSERTLLHITCQKRWPNATRRLLDMGADINTGASTVYGHLPIHYAAANGSRLICEMLLAHKDEFNINHTDITGFTPYDYALRSGNTDVAELLSEYGGVDHK